MNKFISGLIAVFFFSSFVYGETVLLDVTSGIDEKEYNGISVSHQSGELAYVATSGGVYRTRDGGASWKRAHLIGGKVKANFIVMDPDNSQLVYAATDRGLYRTENGGRTWSRVFSGIGSKKIIRCVALGCASSDEIYIGTEAGMFKSVNCGDNWKRAGGLLGKAPVYQIALAPAGSDTIYVLSDSGLYKSKNDGYGWEKLFTYITISDNGGDNETEDEEGPYRPRARSVLVDPVNSARIYLGTEEGVFESGDGGANWLRFEERGLISNDINYLAASPLEPFEMYAATRKGAYQFCKEENCWSQLHPDIGTKDVRFIACDMDRESSVWAATEEGLYKTAQDMGEAELSRLETRRLLSYFKDEPSYREIQEEAIKYAEVHPNKIKRWRSQAGARALLPRLSFGIDQSESDTYEIYTSSTRQYYTVGPDDVTEGWDVSLTWELGDLIWSDDQTQIDVRSKLMAQLRDDILDEVNRYYFERRKLQVELLEAPPNNTRNRIQKELRLEELTANIDALTGGYLSKRLDEIE